MLLLSQALRLDAKKQAGKRAALWDLPIRLLIDHTIKPKVQARFGGRIKALVSGGAPLNPDVGNFFHALGLTLLQGYGQTEAGPVISATAPRRALRWIRSARR
jgi:long-chain acyl-CoA synthetase